MANNVTSTL